MQLLQHRLGITELVRRHAVLLACQMLRFQNMTWPINLTNAAQIDLRSGEERAADKASKLAAMYSPAQISVTAQAGGNAEETDTAADASKHAPQQAAEEGKEADNELAAAAADTESAKEGTQAASLIVHHVALLDKCVACVRLPSQCAVANLKLMSHRRKYVRVEWDGRLPAEAAC